MKILTIKKINYAIGQNYKDFCKRGLFCKIFENGMTRTNSIHHHLRKDFPVLVS